MGVPHPLLLKTVPLIPPVGEVGGRVCPSHPVTSLALSVSPGASFLLSHVSAIPVAGVMPAVPSSVLLNPSPISGAGEVSPLKRYIPTLPLFGGKQFYLIASSL